MLLPFILAIAAATLYALTNHIDKYLISKVVKNADSRSLIVFSTLVAGFAMSVIYAIICEFRFDFDLQSILLLFFNSALYAVSLYYYFKALSRDDTTIVVIMFQLIPVFMLLLSPLVLGNQGISAIQLVGGIVTTIAAIAVTYEPEKKKFSKDKLITLLMMAFVSLSYAVWFIIEKVVTNDHDFNQTMLWSNLTLFIVGIIIFIFLKSYRKAFNAMLKSNGVKIVGLNLLNELLNSFGGVCSNFDVKMDSVALVSFVSQGVQPFIVMIIGIIITKLFPKVEKETVTKKEIIKRVLAIALCIIGLACIEFG